MFDRGKTKFNMIQSFFGWNCLTNEKQSQIWFEVFSGERKTKSDMIQSVFGWNVWQMKNKVWYDLRCFLAKGKQSRIWFKVFLIWISDKWKIKSDMILDVYNYESDIKKQGGYCMAE
jgi:hypothetical protein